MKLSWGLPIEHLSATSLALAINCPEAYRRRYILHEHDRYSGDQFLGSVDHAAHEANLRQKITSGEDLPLDEIKKAYIDSWTERIDEEGEPNWNGADPGDMYERGLKAVELYHRVVSPTIQPIGVEERFDFRLPDIPYPIIGFLDVITKDRVIDRKTSKNKLSKPKPAWRFQAKIYSYATEMPVEIQVVTKQVTPQVVTAQDAPELLMRAPQRQGTEQLILATVRMLNDAYVRYGPDEPWPTNGQLHTFLCNWCRYGPEHEGSCPAWLTTATVDVTSSALPVSV